MENETSTLRLIYAGQKELKQLTIRSIVYQMHRDGYSNVNIAQYLGVAESVVMLIVKDIPSPELKN